jgi:hypothetical protein
MCSEFLLSLFPYTSTCRTFALEIVDRILERNTVKFQEFIKLVPRVYLEALTELVAADAVHSIQIDRDRFQDRARDVLPVLRELSDDLVREIQPNLHPVSMR